MENFINQILGNITAWDYAAGFIFAIIGAIISLRLAALKRNKLSDSTPYKFSWRFLIQDNFQRFFTGLLITFVAFRFAPELLNQEFSMFFCFVIGLLNDQVAGIISKIEMKARD